MELKTAAKTSAKSIGQPLDIVAKDGLHLAATFFATDEPIKGCVIICAALGVPRRVYAAFAAYLASCGYQSLTFDYRGVGDSRKQSAPVSSLRFRDWGEHDINAMLQWALDKAPGQPLYVVGNSCGGQLVGLAPNSVHLNGIVMVAAQLANARYWSFPSNLKPLLMWYILVPLFSLFGEKFSMRRIGNINAPNSILRQWAQWARTPGYLFNPAHRLDTSRYGALKLPVLAYGFDDDTFATAASIDALLTHFPNCTISRRQIAPADLGVPHIGHFGFFKQTMQDTLWRDTVKWLDDRSEIMSKSVGRQ